MTPSRTLIKIKEGPEAMPEFVFIIPMFHWASKMPCMIKIWTKFSSDFDLAQYISSSVKTSECGHIFFLACQELQKKVGIVLLDNLKIYVMYPPMWGII